MKTTITYIPQIGVPHRHGRVTIDSNYIDWWKPKGLFGSDGSRISINHIASADLYYLSYPRRMVVAVISVILSIVTGMMTLDVVSMIAAALAVFEILLFILSRSCKIIIIITSGHEYALHVTSFQKKKAREINSTIHAAINGYLDDRKIRANS